MARWRPDRGTTDVQSGCIEVEFPPCRRGLWRAGDWRCGIFRVRHGHAAAAVSIHHDAAGAIGTAAGAGREGFTWSGVQSVTKKAEWPDWTPPPEMIARQPYLPRQMAGGPGNPLGARAMYLGGTVYRIHGTNAPATSGTRVSSGCIRLTKEDVSDLY